MKRLIALTVAVSIILIINAVGDATAAQNDHRCADCHIWNDCDQYDCDFGPPPEPTAAPFSGLIKHHATPVRVFDHANGLRLFLVGNGNVQEGPMIPHIREFTSWPVGMPDREFVLSTFVNELTDMPVTVTYDPVGEFLRVVTCYPDGKQYIFTIDIDNQVQYETW